MLAGLLAGARFPDDGSSRSSSCGPLAFVGDVEGAGKPSGWRCAFGKSFA